MFSPYSFLFVFFPPKCFPSLNVYFSFFFSSTNQIPFPFQIFSLSLCFSSFSKYLPLFPSPFLVTSVNQMFSLSKYSLLAKHFPRNQNYEKNSHCYNFSIFIHLYLEIKIMRISVHTPWYQSIHPSIHLSCSYFSAPSVINRLVTNLVFHPDFQFPSQYLQE